MSGTVGGLRDSIQQMSYATIWTPRVGTIMTEHDLSREAATSVLFSSVEAHIAVLASNVSQNSGNGSGVARRDEKKREIIFFSFYRETYQSVRYGLV